MKKSAILILFFILLHMILIVSCSNDNNDDTTGPSDTSALRIGALFTFDEDGPVHGRSMLAALETAEADINNYFIDNKSTTTIEFYTKDTEGSIQNLIDGFYELLEQGITVFFVPLTSFELDILMDQVKGSDVVFISPTSTSTSLTLDDNLIRLLPDDSVQASTTAEALTADGVTKLVTLYRSDLWGSVLAEDLASNFTANGGAIEASILYSALVPVINLENGIAQAAEAVTQALETTDASKIAVHIACFEEGLYFLEEASKYPDLAKVRWYSADGFAKNAALLADSEAGTFAATVNLTASIFGEPVSDDYSSLQQKIAEKTGTTPYSPATLLYDAAWIAAKAAAETDMTDTASYKAKVLETAESHEGLFGKAKMNENGDRVNGSFDFWTVTGSGDNYSWEKTKIIEIE